VFFRKKRAQTISEYVILITVVVAFLMSMFTYVKRGTQGLIKATADQIGSQLNAEQDFSSKGGYMNSSDTFINAHFNYEDRTWPGTYQKVFSDGTDTQTDTKSNLGFTEK
jgi:hypothetical protein